MIISTENNYSLTIAVGGGLDQGNRDSVSNMKVDLSLNELEFSSPGHLAALASGLANMRNKSQLTDVTLKTEDQSFQAHRVVLSACSDYFRAMFTDPMRERSQSEIFLCGVSAEGVKHLIDYMYTSKLALSIANIQDVLAAATHLQVPPVVEACSNYLQAQLDTDNCVDVVTLSETYSLPELRNRSYRYMCENLSSLLASTPEFLQRLSPAQLEHLLASDLPVDVSEERVLEAVLDWLAMAPADRLAHAHKLLRRVHLTRIHPAHIIAIADARVASGSRLPRSLLSRLQNLAAEEQGSGGTDLTMTSVIASSLLNSRGMEEAIVKVGGFTSSSGVSNQITYMLPSVDKWQQLTCIPHVECCNFGCAVLKNELYVVGGCFNQSLQEYIHPFGFRYNPRVNKWTAIAPMHRERCRFSLTAHGKNLYALGGCSEETTDNECERYDSESDSWARIGPMPGGARSQHSAVRYQNAIVVCGGLDAEDHLPLDSVLLYHPSREEWENRRPMRTSRADHAMLAWRNKVLVCGGWNEGGVEGNRVLVDTVEVYDVQKDEWVIETRVPTPRYHSGVAVVGDKLYVIGGFHSVRLFDNASGLIECYDLESRVWNEVERYPMDVWEHACTSLFVPKGRLDIEVLPQQ